MEQLSPDQALDRLKLLIKTGRLDVNYVFENTEKNKQFWEEYYIDVNKRIEILLTLDETDYVKDEYSNDLGQQDYFYVYIKKGFLLMPRYSAKMQYEPVNIYIKFYFVGENRSPVVVLSFHKAGDY